jgi:hypothetical protein
MPKSRKRRRAAVRAADRAVALERVRDAIVDMEQPIAEIGALLWAFDLIGAGMRERADEDGGRAVTMVADCARERLESLKGMWNLVFHADIGKPAT